MSHAATKWAWDQLDIAGSEKLVLIRLADHASPEGTSIRPGMKSLMAHTGLSERQIRRYIQGFLDRGLIAYEANEKAGRSNIPTFCIPAVKADADDRLSEYEKGTPVSANTSKRRTPMTVKADTHDRTLKEEPSGTVNTQVVDEKSATPLTQEKSNVIHVAAPPPKDEEKPKGKRPENGPGQRIMAAFCDAVGIDRLPNYDRAGGTARNLVNAGVTAEDIPDMVAWCFEQTWLKGGIDLDTLYRNVVRWKTDRTGMQRKSAGPPGVDLLPGETAFDMGDGRWELRHENGVTRLVDPAYYGVIFDPREHRYDGVPAFHAAVREAKAKAERNEVAA